MKKMKLHKLIAFAIIGMFFAATACEKSGYSLYDPDYEPSQPTPEVDTVLPEGGYLAGVDAITIKGKNFATGLDSMTIDFSGVPGKILSSTKTEMQVRPAKTFGDVDIRISVRGAEFFSDKFPYYLDDAYNFYEGVDKDFIPLVPIAIDENDNIYTIIDNKGTGKVRYTKITPDGQIEIDDLPESGEKDENDVLYPATQTMRFKNYSSFLSLNNGTLLMTQQSVWAIFQKTFGDGVQETVWAASSNNKLRIRDTVIDSNGFLWVVGSGSDQVHRFDLSTKAETQYDVEGKVTSVAVAGDNLYLAGEIEGTSVKVWKADINGGNFSNLTEYFDFSAHYDGDIKDMILDNEGSLYIATDGEANIVQVESDGNHSLYYEDVVKPRPFALSWNSDNLMIVANESSDASLNYLNTWDKERAGIFYQ